MNILCISADFPYPPDFGGRMRTYNMLKRLAKNNTVHLLTIGSGSREDIQAVKKDNIHIHTVTDIPWNRQLTLVEKLYFHANAIGNRTHPIIERIKSYQLNHISSSIIQKESIDIIILEFSYLSFLAKDLKYQFPNCRILLDAHNSESLLLKDIAASSKGIVSMYKKYFAHNMKRIESDLHHYIDLAICVSEADCKRFKELNHNALAITLTPNGCDIEYYNEFLHTEQPNEPTLIFCGLMNYRPNYEGIIWFVKKIFPKIETAIPEVQLLIVGKNPIEGVKKLQTDKHIIVTGFVKDVREFYQNAQIAIVPLHLGGGTRLKILEAMAMHKPVISTSIGAEGIEKTPGIIIHDDEQAFAHTIITLLQNRDLQQSLGEQNQQFVIDRYNWDNIVGKLEQTVLELTNTHY